MPRNLKESHLALYVSNTYQSIEVKMVFRISKHRNPIKTGLYALHRDTNGKNVNSKMLC